MLILYVLSLLGWTFGILSGTLSLLYGAGAKKFTHVQAHYNEGGKSDENTQNGIRPSINGEQRAAA